MKRMDMYRNAFLMMMVFSLLVGCRTSAKSTAEGGLEMAQTGKDSCMATSGRLSADETLAGQTGIYQLTLVEVVNGNDSRSVRGTLRLRKQPQGLESLGSASTPLYGFTDVDIKAVGAYRVGSLASEDPQAPGVLVLEGNYAGEKSILLRLGSIANQRDLRRYDGTYAVLEVGEITTNGFAGNWRSGISGSRIEGYFCAMEVFRKRCRWLQWITPDSMR